MFVDTIRYSLLVLKEPLF